MLSIEVSGGLSQDIHFCQGDFCLVLSQKSNIFSSLYVFETWLINWSRTPEVILWFDTNLLLLACPTLGVAQKCLENVIISVSVGKFGIQITKVWVACAKGNKISERPYHKRSTSIEWLCFVGKITPYLNLFNRFKWGVNFLTKKCHPYDVEL